MVHVEILSIQINVVSDAGSVNIGTTLNLISKQDIISEQRPREQPDQAPPSLPVPEVPPSPVGQPTTSPPTSAPHTVRKENSINDETGSAP
jgi:hypothetical protein